MQLHEEFNVIGNWFRIHYLLNPGMAFGLELDWPYGKMLLSIFRLVATVGIGYLLYLQIKARARTIILVSLSLILGGAIGNAVDSVFYGVLLEGNAIPGSPTPWFHGQVIDMLYFPMIEGFIPSWSPIWAGKHFIFFSPVFNIADSSIFIGISLAILFQKSFFNHAHSDSFATKAKEEISKENLS